MAKDQPAQIDEAAMREKVRTVREKLAGKVSDEEFCRVFGISRVTSWRYRRDGLLPSVPVGKTIFYMPEDVEAFLSRRSRDEGANKKRRKHAA